MSKAGLNLRWLAVPLSFIAFNPATMAAVCGPGVDWVKDCPAGTDNSPSKAEVQLEIPCGSTPTPIIKLNGPTIVERQAGTSVPPYTIDTEMVGLKLSGNAAGIGKITIRGGRDIAPEQQPIMGQITQNAGDTVADSYFDVFVAVDTPIGTLYSKEACRMKATIDRVPPWHPANPDNVYICEDGNTVLELFVWDDLNGNGIIDNGELGTQPVACLIKDISKHLSVTLKSLSASQVDSDVKLVWETGTESMNAGFNIYRAIKNQNGEFINITKINDNLIPSQAIGNSGANYTLVDNTVESGTYYYAVVDVEYTGNSTTHMDDIIAVTVK